MTLTAAPTESPSTFQHRARIYLQSVLDAGGKSTDAADSIFQLVPSEIFRLIPQLELDRGPLDTTPLSSALERIANRRDCADFVLAGIQRIMALYSESRWFSADLREPMERAVLDFGYWYDQPGIQGMCFHTENHQILFHSCEVLAGQQFARQTFGNSGKTGRWHAEHGTKLALRWIDERARFGFVEWLSCYFEEDLLALLNLADFAFDSVLRERSRMLVDMILFEIALHAHNGILGTTHGRTYAEYVKGGREDPISAISWLVFGKGVPTNRPNLALTALSTSGYRCPDIIQAVASDVPHDRLSRENCGLSVASASACGFDPGSQDSQMFFWACQTARHPLAREASVRMTNVAKDDWLAKFVEAADEKLEVTRALVESGGAKFDGDAINTALSPANLISFRTPDYMLSCAQDFRAGRPGYQQHVWQATLDVDAVVFTNHPGAANESSAHADRPNFWAGNRFLPRAAQWRNVLICIHHAPADDEFPFSHAYFPRDHFDETDVRGNWTFGRKGEGYVALYSQHAAVWSDDGSAPLIELRAESPDNIWICEMGTAAQWGSLSGFADAVAYAAVACQGLHVDYESPSLGKVSFGYTGPLSVAGEEVQLADYPRFDNIYCKAALGVRTYTIERAGERLVWDFGVEG
jgi:hypothetical protein